MEDENVDMCCVSFVVMAGRVVKLAVAAPQTFEAR